MERAVRDNYEGKITRLEERNASLEEENARLKAENEKLEKKVIRTPPEPGKMRTEITVPNQEK